MADRTKSNELIYLFIEEVKLNLENLKDCFYRGSENGAGSLIIRMIDHIDIILEGRNIFNDYVNVEKIEEILPELLEAMENEDSILVGDLLNYEIIQAFK